jgi:hypothetical protein
MALSPVHAELSRHRRFIGRAWDRSLLRNCSALGEPFRTDDRGGPAQTPIQAASAWHLDEAYLEIDGRMVYLWRVVDAEGEVLDVLVQAKRNKRAALKLMRKLLKKYRFVPEALVTDDLRSYRTAAVMC